MKNIFIIGARGYHEDYGGWETFVSNFVDNYNDKSTNFFITKFSEEKIDNELIINNNIVVKPIYVKVKNNLKMFIYTIKSLNYVIKYIQKNKISNAYIYILGLKLLNYLNLKKPVFKKLGIQILVNPDGLEWKRSKWNTLGKTFFKLSERFMLYACDIIVCDSLGIKDYINNKYPKLKDKCHFIAYGYNNVDVKGIDESKILKEYNLEKDNYCLVVGRFVPENNIELIINEFMKSKINKKLFIISNYSSTKYYFKVLKNTNCLEDKRIVFVDGIYDPIKLSIIRKNAYLYIHGHSVGGTNPSLIESLSLTDLNILFDVNFNKYAGLDSCLYFKDCGSLTKLLNNTEYLDSVKKDLGIKAKKIAVSNFTWDIVIKKYKELLK